MVQFTKLRLSGFKSFVDPTELVIEPGMTGIVGPNGCGKSNLLEAMRWCMGEGSAKQLRGDGMDDVIFSGTSSRPPRNVAEVVIGLVNDDRRAPAAFNDFEDLEIVRRIQRESGSAYKVNGKDVRARDVQLLFADLSTGARSTAIVSQGRIGAVVNSKPTERRVLLEEAAGITGLHSRRHEAELRLRAAENNLTRLEDVVVALQAQLQGLRRQSRQATRYRNLSDLIRKAEAIQLHLRWQSSVAELDAARTALRQVEQEVGELSREAASLSTRQAEASAGLPGMRQREAEAAATLQSLLVARDRLDAEADRIETEIGERRARLEQIDADKERETAFNADAISALTRLEEESDRLRADQESEKGARVEADEAVKILGEEVRGLDEATTALTRKVAADEARRTNLERQIADGSGRLERLARRRAEVEAEISRLSKSDAQTAVLAAAEATKAAAGALETAQAEAESTEARKQSLESALDAPRAAARAAEAEVARHAAEEDALRAVLEKRDDGDFPPVLDRVKAKPGYEQALGVALGEDLTAPSDQAAGVHWGATAGVDDGLPLPDGAAPLSDFVKAPAELARRLAQIAVVADEDAATALVGKLRQGQRLVTQTGALWRWDGFAMKAGAPTAAATRLKQENRLTEVAALRERAEAEADEARRVHEAATAAHAEATGAARQAAEAARAAFANANRTRDAENKAERAAADVRSRLAGQQEGLTALDSDRAETEERLSALRAEQDGLPPLDEERLRLDDMAETLTNTRNKLAETQQNRNRLAAEAERRAERLIAIGDEQRAWTTRQANSERQIAQLDERREEVSEALGALETRPAEIADQIDALEAQIATAAAARKRAADTLSEAETALGTVDRALKEAERRLADLRESKGRHEGAVSQAGQGLETVVARIAERLSCAPGEALALAELKEDEALPPLDTTTAKLEKLVRERENMGPVNLRAEQEAQELEEQIETYESERGDLIAAIEKFRKAIAELNREGRERLLASFEAVNSHFESLFTRLFGGGRAHLKLTEAEDPLDAGLEIMASPPGKRLQSLSLLSGGEKALTALALLFAVFLTNPAPICVLDEVDAPLDDSNVDRFCSLVEEIARETGTRFLIVTHHRMSMARMDRLYGVTMSERGVSQLVSVDLQKAAAIVETASVAAE